MRVFSFVTDFPFLFGFCFKKEKTKGKIDYLIETEIKKLHFWTKKDPPDFLIFFFSKNDGFLIKKTYKKVKRNLSLFDEKVFDEILKESEKELLKEAKKEIKKPSLLFSKILEIKLDGVLLSDPFGVPFKEVEIKKINFYLSQKKYSLFSKILRKIKTPAKIFVKEAIYDTLGVVPKTFQETLFLRFKNLKNLFKIEKKKYFWEASILTELFLEGKI